MAKQKLTRRRLRLLGILPLTFFVAQAIHYLDIHELGNMLWMCNIGNLMLALGLLLEKPVLVRVAVIWTIPGLIVWCVYVVPTWGMLLTGQFTWSALFGVVSSTLAHTGGISIGLVALQKIRMDVTSWLYAFGWYFILQLLSRLFTPAGMNVNLSHRVQDGLERFFPVYWKFWLLLTLMVGVCSWLIGLALNRLWPPAPAGPESP